MNVVLTRESVIRTVMEMRTRVAERLGVEFPICAVSHAGDVATAVSDASGPDTCGASARGSARANLVARVNGGNVSVASLAGSAPLHVDFGVDSGPDSLGTPVQSAQTGGPLARINRFATQPDSSGCDLTTNFVGHAADSTDEAKPMSLDMVAEFDDAVELLNDVICR